MLHDVRNKSSTYRVHKTTVDSTTTYAVTVYPLQRSGAEEPVATGIYRSDMLPTWMLEGISTLDVAGTTDVQIPFFGDKKGDSYWFFSDDMYEQAQLAFMSPGFYWDWNNLFLSANHKTHHTYDYEKD